MRVVRHTVALPSYKAGARALKIAFASDFHAGPTSDPAVLRQACEALRAARPDVLLLGGDFVTFLPAEIDWLAPELGAVTAPHGRYAVLGNHDWWADTPYIVERLESAGIQVLTNRNVRLDSPFDDIWICGLDDHWCGEPDAKAALTGAVGSRVVLMHSPSALLDLDGARFDLALCGHTHGGQLALPGGIPIVVPHGPLSRRYGRGRFALEDGRTLIVSVGLGCVVLPLRLFADPEILICELTPSVPTSTPDRAASHRPAAGRLPGEP